MQASVDQNISVLACTKSPFARTRLHNERLGGGVTVALDGSVDRGSGDAEEFGDLRGGVFAALVDLDQVLLLRFGQFGFLAARPTRT